MNAELIKKLKELGEGNVKELDRMFETCLTLGSYDTMKSNLRRLSPEEYPNYTHYLNELEKRTRETAEVA